MLKYMCTDNQFNLSSSSEEEINLKDVLSVSSESSSDEYEERKSRCAILNYVENVVCRYDNGDFKRHFGLSRESAYHIIAEVENEKVLPQHIYGREKITSEKAVLMSIWYLSNTETFRQIADRFNVSQSSSHRIIKRIINYLVNISTRYIQWPAGDRKESIRQGFKAFHNIDNILGVIDGCHIQIKKPLRDAEVYCNRKSDYSILLQAVCDHEKKCLDVFCGEAGSIHDARMFKRSSIYNKGINGFLNGSILIGDSAYPCLPWLITPFKDNGQLTENQKKFNYRLSSSRILIENAFGLLKGRFRRLKNFENNNILFIIKCVVAATVLHNICLSHDDLIQYENEENVDNLHFDEILCFNNHNGNEKRNEIFNGMFRN